MFSLRRDLLVISSLITSRFIYLASVVRSMHLERAIGPFLVSKSRGGSDSGNYRRNVERCVVEFVEWVEQNDPPATTDSIDARTCRRYARHLAGRDLAESTVHTYYANVSAFIGWCTREGLLDENYAQRHEAIEELPSKSGRRTRQQAWKPDERNTLLRYADERVQTAFENGGDPLGPVRDRALVAVLAYAGIRIGELVRARHDDRREGVTWSDVSLPDGSITVLSKKQEWDDRALPAPTREPLRTLKTVADPHEHWPVFPTIHRPTLYKTARNELESVGVSETAIKRRLDRNDPLEILREEGSAPPAITTDGARRVLRRLTEEAGLNPEGRHDYLVPHGARRGAGEAMVRRHGVTAAARLLDNSERIVREAYSHIEAGEIAKLADEAFEESDGEIRESR